MFSGITQLGSMWCITLEVTIWEWLTVCITERSPAKREAESALAADAMAINRKIMLRQKWTGSENGRHGVR